MNNDSKYYTPDIGEFHVGFQFESYGSTLDNLECRWMKCVFSHKYSDMLGFTESERSEAFRVKYLDAIDIEGEGWESSRVNGLIQKEFFTGPEEEWRLKYFGAMDPQAYPRANLREVEIYKWGELTFRGNIKNRSELRKLQSQLGIEAKQPA